MVGPRLEHPFEAVCLPVELRQPSVQRVTQAHLKVTENRQQRRTYRLGPRITTIKVAFAGGFKEFFEGIEPGSSQMDEHKSPCQQIYFLLSCYSTRGFSGFPVVPVYPE
ncbi:hypothetical protein D3C85_1062120 [compost metagenome]